MLPSFCRDVVTVHRAQLVELRGSLVRDWANETTHDITGCSFQAFSTSRDMDSRTSNVEIDATLYANPNADIAEGDRVEFHGSTYELMGAPIPYPGATGALDHYEIPLRRWAG